MRICIVGPDRAGKSSFANFLAKKLVFKDPAILSITKPLKQATKILFPGYEDSLKDTELSKGKTYREFIMDLSATAKKYNKNVLIDLLDKKIEGLETDLLIFDDLRYITQIKHYSPNVVVWVGDTKNVDKYDLKKIVDHADYYTSQDKKEQKQVIKKIIKRYKKYEKEGLVLGDAKIMRKL